MAILSVLCRVFVFNLILKQNLILSNPYHLQHGNHSTTYAPRNEAVAQLANILCPVAAAGSYPYPFSNFGYIVCWHQKTNYENCPMGEVYNLRLKRCVRTAGLQFQLRKKVFLCRCPYFDSSKHFYPFNATKYVQCFRGELKVLDCGPCEMFSLQQRRCLPATQISPDDHVPLPASTYNDIIFCPLKLFGIFAHPFDNKKYLKCTDGRLYDKSCAPGFIYNFVSRLCVENTEHVFHTLPSVQADYFGDSVIETRKSDNLTFLRCPKGLSGTFVHPFSCVDYIYCSPAGTQVHTCSEGKLYSFRKGKCEWRGCLDTYEHVPCEASSQGEDDEEEDSISLGVFCAPAGYRNYTHPQTQYKYIQCNNGELRVKRCPRNEVFDVDDLICVIETTSMDEEDYDE